MENFRELFEQNLNDDEIDEFHLAEKCFEFIEDNVDIDNLDDEQSDKFNEILETIETVEDFDEDESLDEFTTIKKKISPKLKRERARSYKKNKVSLKLKAKKYRKTSKFKKYKKKAKKAAKRGKTSSGKKQTTFR